jgi:alkaline phosphatase
MRYIDGFVIPIPKRKVAAYRRLAQKAARVWMDHGALEYIEAVGDDLKPDQVVATFPKLARAKPGETVVFSYIVYKSRAHRDRVNAKVMQDPRMNRMIQGNEVMPFDMKRMAYGGFKSIVDR